MATDRWPRIEALYHEMLARPEHERAAALRAACAGDAALLADVQSLLDQPEPTAGFLATPALDIAARLVSPDRSVLPIESGTRLGPYEIETLLGAGGMGEVYRARDTRLGRDVAIKVLPQAWSADRDRLRRFAQEARATAALNHPRICTIYDVGHEAGTDYFVLEYLEGESLADRLSRGPLKLDEAMRAAIEDARHSTPRPSLTPVPGISCLRAMRQSWRSASTPRVLGSSALPSSWPIRSEAATTPSTAATMA
jgi:hypothetical protein